MNWIIHFNTSSTSSFFVLTIYPWPPPLALLPSYNILSIPLHINFLFSPYTHKHPQQNCVQQCNSQMIIFFPSQNSFLNQLSYIIYKVKTIYFLRFNLLSDSLPQLYRFHHDFLIIQQTQIRILNTSLFDTNLFGQS